MAGLANSSSALQQWHALFQARGGQVSPQAQEHLRQVKLLGLPSRKDEDWKYTSLDKLLGSTFV
ncbi:signal peptide peptidase SppA, partial [Kluyvera cryocrescens]